MANREDKRAQRQKRKARGVERRVAQAERSERKNREAREKLEPLEENERPTVVTICAVIATLIAVGTVVAYLAGATFRGDRPPLIDVFWTTFLMGMASYGLWRARYWAVLGFDVVLVLFLIVAVFGLISAKSVLGAIVLTVLVAGAGALFFFMVKAMARIQMPERRTPGAGR